MDWLIKLVSSLPTLRIEHQSQTLTEQKTLVLLQKVNVLDLEECKPKGIIRERTFWKTERVDFYHLLSDNSIKHTPG